ncbi:MAG: hypothetical protein F6J97_23965 [Leptolyngbya sp. SIO4C1]|nr:hypothetical protein [Leptolyngbya sp. SIO4C1]
MLTGPNLSKAAILIRERQREEERMQDVQLLLENLFQREEATLNIIVDCLYEVGSTNLINRRFRNRPLNRIMKWIARLTKPGFHLFAVRWSKKNAPKLIAEWLHSQVSFR